jgi:hypothetical protein
MSRLAAQRLFNLLPPRMPTATKLELAGNIWRHFGPSSARYFTVGPTADAKSVVDAISAKLNAAIQTYQIPDQVRKRFERLSSGDVRVKEELLNYFRKMEQDLVISKLHQELPVLQKQLQDYAEQTVSVRTKLEIHHNSVEIWIGHRLGDKYREGLPSENANCITCARGHLENNRCHYYNSYLCQFDKATLINLRMFKTKHRLVQPKVRVLSARGLRPGRR